MSETSYKLDELAKAAGTSPRTVRYYVQRGLLPPPVFRGKDSTYGHEHLVRLRAIRKLQEAYLPLDAIAAELEGKAIEAIERLAHAERAKNVPVPSPVPKREEHEAKASTWHHHELGRGLSLNVADDAPPESKALADQILKLISSVKEGA